MMELLLIIATIIVVSSIGSGSAEAVEPPSPPLPPKSAEQELADALSRLLREYRQLDLDNEHPEDAVNESED